MIIAQEPAIEARRFAEVQAVVGVGFDVREGELFGISLRNIRKKWIV